MPEQEVRGEQDILDALSQMLSASQSSGGATPPESQLTREAALQAALEALVGGGDTQAIVQGLLEQGITLDQTDRSLSPGLGAAIGTGTGAQILPSKVPTTAQGPQGSLLRQAQTSEQISPNLGQLFASGEEELPSSPQGVLDLIRDLLVVAGTNQ